MSILVPLNDSVSSRGVVDFLLRMPLCPDSRIVLIHIFRKPSSGEELMGRKFMEELPARLERVLLKAKQMLIEEKGFNPSNIGIDLVNCNFPTVTEAIIDYFNKGNFEMVVIGRKQMSRSEEFVLGDISAKLIRSLPNTAILVIKTG